MISVPTYQAARVVSEIVEKHFSERLKVARAAGESNLAPDPNARIIEAIIDAAFWSSLRREEGHAPRISLAFLPPEMSESALLFQHRMPLTTETLTKISPGVERAGVHLGVWYNEDEVYVWGTTLRVPDLCFILDVSEPGLLVVKHRRRQGFGKFANVAVLIGDQVKVVDESYSERPECPPFLQSLLGTKSLTSPNDYMHVLVQLAVSMRSHGHGGTLLVVPETSNNWRASIIHPIKYSVSPVFSGLSNLMKKDMEDRTKSLWQESARKEIDSIAGFTAVDGATIITDNYSLLAFGAKIGLKEGSAQIEKIQISEPVLGGDAVVVNPAQTGGTRHLSAAQFVHDQHDALALVASQDGQFTIFSWSEEAGMVQGQRIDTLLL